MEKTDTNATMKQQQPPTMTRKVGGMTYEVAIHFSETSKETMNDKILRLIQNDAKNQPSD